MKPHTPLIVAALLTVTAGCVIDDDGPDTEVTTAELAPGEYQLVRSGSGKCLDVKGNATSNGTRIHQWTCHGGGAQTFRLDHRGGEVYRLIHPGSGKCVDVIGNASASGTELQLWSCSSTSAAQRFRLEPSGSGTSQLRHTGSDKCVDVSASSNADGAKVQIWACNGTDAQRWRLDLRGGGGSGGGGGGGGGIGPKWADAVVTAYTFQDNSACNSVMTASGRPLIPYLSVALPFRYLRGLGQGPFALGDQIYVAFLAGRTMPNGLQHTGWVQIDDFCGDHGDDAYCFQNGKPNVDLYIGDWATSGMSCLASNQQAWGTGSFSGPAGRGQENTAVFFGPAPAGAIVPSYGGRAKGAGNCGDCRFGRTVQPPACWHYDPGSTNIQYCSCSNSNGVNGGC